MLKRSSLLTSLSFFSSPCQKCKRRPLWLVRCSKSEIARKLLITQNRKNYQKRKKRIVSKKQNTLFQPTGTVLDKIQAELAETRRREEELKRSRSTIWLPTHWLLTWSPPWSTIFVANTFVVNLLVLTTLSTIWFSTIWLSLGLSTTLVVTDA